LGLLRLYRFCQDHWLPPGVDGVFSPASRKVWNLFDRCAGGGLGWSEKPISKDDDGSFVAIPISLVEPARLNHTFDIAGLVAAMTEGELDVVSERAYTTFLVDRDSATRRARRLAVQFDVGELSLGS